MLNLPDVTLVCVTSVKHDQNVKALKKSMEGIQYGDVKFISDICPEDLPKNVKCVKCDKLSYDGFSEYTFLKLWKDIETTHCLLVHHDGFVIRPDLWSDEFLKFDYVAAPWPFSDTSYITDDGEHVDVGNGGFCLRTKKILELPTQLGLKLEHRQGFYNDDGNFCVYHRKTFLENGIKYAPKEIAAKFSSEIIIPGLSQESFGFHSFIHHPQFENYIK